MTDLQACQALLARLDLGGTVTVAEARLAIGTTYTEQLDSELDHARALRGEALAASRDLRDYVRQLQIADMHYQTSQKRLKASSSRLELKALTEYETALEKLTELLAIDPSLERHLDRKHDWNKVGGGGMVHADYGAVPRIKYHRRNVHGEAEHKEIQLRSEVVRAAIEDAIANPQTEVISVQAPAAMTDDESELIKAKLSKLKSLR